MHVLIRERSFAVRARVAGGEGRLKAFIVPNTVANADTLAPLLQQVIATRLASHEQPRRLRFGHALPRYAIGKLKDWS